MHSITVETEIQVSDIGWAMRYERHDDIVDFVLQLDAEIADIDFTKKLRDALNEVIEVEEGE